MTHYGDIKTLSGFALPSVDVIIGGSPCQDSSAAGKRAGLAGERSNLFLEQIRIVEEMQDATDGVYPRYMVWETVSPCRLGSGCSNAFPPSLSGTPPWGACSTESEDFPCCGSRSTGKEAAFGQVKLSRFAWL